MRRWRSVLAGAGLGAMVLLLGPATGYAQAGERPPLEVRVVTDEADAVLAILEKRQRGEAPGEQDWERLFASEGYRRLKKREESMGRPFPDSSFRVFVVSDSLAARADALRQTVASWKRTELEAAARRAFAYLPEGARIRATVYPVIKRAPNSFVFGIDTDPAIFLYVDPAVRQPKFENTVAHELHHIGYGTVCRSDYAGEREAAAELFGWMGAFGEGLAMLAAAGGPDVHPHAVSEPDERARWDRDVAGFGRDLGELERFFLDVLEGRLTEPAAIRRQAARYYGEQGPWYTVGWRMASVVETVYGRARLMEVLCDPRELLLTYNVAAAEYGRASGERLAVWSPRLTERLRPAAGGAESGSWPSLDVSAYDLDVRPDFDRGSVSVSAKLTLKNRGGAADAEASLLLHRLLRVRAVTDADGAAVPFSQEVVAFEDFPKLQVNRTRLHLPRPLAPGGESVVTVEYDGYVTPYTETGWLYVRDRIHPEFSILREDAFAYPIAGVPSMAARRAAGFPRFTYRARITVPDTLVVANGGELVGREAVAGSRVAYSYRSIVPSWRMDFAIAPYRVLEDGGVRVFHFAQDSAGAARVLASLGRALRLYTERMGPLRGPGSFAVIEIPDGWGSQTDATSIIQTAAAFVDPALVGELYHEVSHLWNVESKDPAFSRWNEGLAMYLQHRAEEALDGGAPVRERAGERAERLRRTLAREPRLREVPMADYGRMQMTGHAYTVGMLMFAALEERIGRDRLDRIVGEYYRRYSAAGATTDDFVRLARSIGGKQAEAVLGDWYYTTRWAEQLDR